jgi:cytochrome c peroxidase
MKHISALLLLLPVSLLGCAAGTTSTTTAATTTTTTTPVVTIPNVQPYADSTGTVATYTTAGSIVESNDFFQALGSNTRTCATCHQPNQGMSITPTALQTLFTSTAGADPVFDAIDGANCPTVATGSTAGHSLILNNGLIRIPITLPATAQFTITVLSDPYGCAATLSTTGQQVVSVYRRPLPTASLPFLSTVMWDTRETLAALTSATTLDAALTTDLTDQMNTAVTTHEQGAANPTTAQVASVLPFEQGLFTAQTTDTAAGSLSVNGATGGPTNLAAQNYYPGINDAFGGDPTGAKFNPAAMTLYTAWANSTNAQQASIARGENIFNNSPMKLTNVSGLPPVNGPGTCTTCHDAPNLGHHSLPLPIDTGVMHVAANETDPNVVAGLAQLSSPSLPVYQITGCKVNGTAVTYVTTDPGKALTTGLCADVNHLKIPLLRGLAARAPYFHNGSAPNVAAVVNFYNARFQMGLNAGQKTDLVNFLNAL